MPLVLQDLSEVAISFMSSYVTNLGKVVYMASFITFAERVSCKFIRNDIECKILFIIWWVFLQQNTPYIKNM